MTSNSVDWGSGLRQYEVKIDDNFYSATSHGEVLQYAEKFSQEKDRSRPTTTQILFHSKKAYENFLKQKAIEEKAEQIRQSLLEDEFEEKMAYHQAIIRVDPKPNYSQRLLNRIEHLLKYRKPIHMNCGYTNHALWSRKSTVLEEYLRAQIKGKKLDNLDAIHVLNLMRENYKIQLMDIVWSDSESNPDLNQIFRFSSFEGKTLKKESIISLEFDALTLTLVNDFLSLQKKIRQNHGVLPFFIKDNYQSATESDFRVEATLTAITKEGFLHIRPLCTSADFVLAMHELLDPQVLSEGFINIPHILHVHTERSTEGYYRYHYRAKEKSFFQYRKVTNIPSERKELRNYIYSLLNYTDYYFDSFSIDEHQVPRDLFEFAYKTLLSLNLLFHPANEIITHLTMDIEFCESFADVSKLHNAITPPHLASKDARNNREFSYRVISFSGLEVQKCLSADRRHAICNLDGLSQAFLRDFHKYFHREWNYLLEGKPFTSSLDSVLPSSLVTAQELAGRLHRKLDKLKYFEESSSSDEEVIEEPAAVPSEESNQIENLTNVEKPLSAAAARRKSKDVALKAKETADLLAKHRKNAILREEEEKIKEKERIREQEKQEREKRQRPSWTEQGKPLVGRKSNVPLIRKSLVGQSNKEGKASSRASFIKQEANPFAEKMKAAREQHIDELIKLEEERKRLKAQPNFNLLQYHLNALQERAFSPLAINDESIVSPRPPSPVVSITLPIPTSAQLNLKPSSPVTIAKEALVQFIAPAAITEHPQLHLTADILAPRPFNPANIDSEKEQNRLKVLSRPDADDNEDAYEYASKIDLLKLLAGVDNLPNRIEDIKNRKMRAAQKEKERKQRLKEEKEKEEEEEEAKRKKEGEIAQPSSLRVGSPPSRASTAGRSSLNRKAFQEKRMEEVEQLLQNLLTRVDILQDTMTEAKATETNQSTLSVVTSPLMSPVASPIRTMKSTMTNGSLWSPQKTLGSTITSNQSGAPSIGKMETSVSPIPSPTSPSKPKSHLYKQLQAYLERIRYLKLQRFIKRRRKQESLTKEQVMGLLFYYQSIPESYWKELQKDDSKDHLEQQVNEKEEEEQLLNFYLPNEEDNNEDPYSRVDNLLGDYSNLLNVEEAVQQRIEESKPKKELPRRSSYVFNESLKRSFLQRIEEPVNNTDLLTRKNLLMSKGHTNIRMSNILIDGRILLPAGLSADEYEEIYRPKTAQVPETTIHKNETKDENAVSPENLDDDPNNQDDTDDRWEKMTDTLSSVMDANTIDENEMMIPNSSKSVFSLSERKKIEMGNDHIMQEPLNEIDEEAYARRRSSVAEQEDLLVSIIFGSDHIIDGKQTQTEKDEPSVRFEDAADDDRIKQFPETFSAKGEEEDKETILVDVDLLELLQNLIIQLPELTKAMKQLSRPVTSTPHYHPPATTTRSEGRERTTSAAIETNPLFELDPLIKNTIRPTTTTPAANFAYNYQDRIDPQFGLHQNVNEKIKRLFTAKPPPINSRQNTPAQFYQHRSPRSKHQKRIHPIPSPTLPMKKEISFKEFKDLHPHASTVYPRFGIKGKTMQMMGDLIVANSHNNNDSFHNSEVFTAVSDVADPFAESSRNSNNQKDEKIEEENYYSRFHHQELSHFQSVSSGDQFSDTHHHHDHHELTLTSAANITVSRRSPPPSTLEDHNTSTTSTISHELRTDQIKQWLATETNPPPSSSANGTGILQTTSSLNYKYFLDLYTDPSDLLISGKKIAENDQTLKIPSPTSSHGFTSRGTSPTARDANKRKILNKPDDHIIAEDLIASPPLKVTKLIDNQLPSISLSLHSTSLHENLSLVNEPPLPVVIESPLSPRKETTEMQKSDLNALRPQREDQHLANSIESVISVIRIAVPPIQLSKQSNLSQDQLLHESSVFSISSKLALSPSSYEGRDEVIGKLNTIGSQSIVFEAPSVNTLLDEIRGKKFNIPAPKIIPPRSRYTDNTINSISNMKKQKKELDEQEPTSTLLLQQDERPLSRSANRWNYLLDYLEQTFEASHQKKHNENKDANIQTIIKPKVLSIVLPKPSEEKTEAVVNTLPVESVLPISQPTSSTASATFLSPNRKNRKLKSRNAPALSRNEGDTMEQSKPFPITSFIAKVGGSAWNKPLI